VRSSASHGDRGGAPASASPFRRTWEEDLHELIAKGKVTRSWLGGLDPTADARAGQVVQREDNKGVLISDVVGDSPAAKAGLQPGDILIEFDGKKMEDRPISSAPSAWPIPATGQGEALA